MCRSMSIYCLVYWFSSRFYFACARVSSFDARKKHEFPCTLQKEKHMRWHPSARKAGLPQNMASQPS